MGYKKFGIEEIGMKVKFLREELGYTQAQLAEEVGKSPFGITIVQGQIGNIESGDGKNLPSARLLGALAFALDTSTDFLCGLTNDEMSRSDREGQVVKDVKDENVRLSLQAICNYVVESGMSADDLDLLLILAQRISSSQPSGEITHVSMGTMFRKIRETSGKEGEDKLFDLLDNLSPGTFRSLRGRSSKSLQ